MLSHTLGFYVATFIYSGPVTTGPWHPIPGVCPDGPVPTGLQHLIFPGLGPMVPSVGTDSQVPSGHWHPILPGVHGFSVSWKHMLLENEAHAPEECTLGFCHHFSLE